MNKRQRKKQVKRLARELEAVDLQTVLSNIADKVSKMVDAILRITNELPRIIRDMPEEEFQKKLAELPPTSRGYALALRFRYGPAGEEKEDGDGKD